MANGFSGLTDVLSGLSGVLSGVRNVATVIRGPTAAAPAPVLTAGPALPAIVGGSAAGTAVGTLAGRFLGGNGTPLQRARDATGRRVTRKQIIMAARHCGMEIAADTFGISVTDVCQVVAKGMPRRSRGISATDMRRTRSTLRKMNTMRKSLRPLCR